MITGPHFNKLIPYYRVGLSAIIGLALCGRLFALPQGTHVRKPTSSIAPPFVRPVAPKPPNIPLDEVGLHVVAAGGVQVPRNNLGFYYFDLINRLDTPVITQSVVLRNESNVPLGKLNLHLARTNGLNVLVTRRGTTRQAPSVVADTSVLPTLQPKEELTLYISLNLASRPPGAITETIEITAPDHGKPVVGFVMIGTVLPVVTFTPNMLNFAKIPAQQTRSLNLTVSIDPRLAPYGSVPKLYCSNPDVQIEPIPLDESMKRTSPLMNTKQKVAGLYSYLVTLSDEASVGPIHGSLFVASITPPKEKPDKRETPFKPLSAEQVSDALHGVAATLTGTVIGDVTAAPTTIAFNGVAQGKEAVQRVVLTPETATTLRNMQINSPVPWLYGRWAAPDPAPLRPNRNSNPKPMQTLEVVLSPHAPVGRLQTQLVLTLANGQRLVLPVSAVVFPQAAKH